MTAASRRPLPLYLVAAFADRPYGGNPAGVCLLQGEEPAAELQAIAREWRQPETAFLWPTADGWRVRWFSPEVEVDLCGHATLAAAHVLWVEGLAPEHTPLRFLAAATVLEARRAGDGRVLLDFPALAGEPAPPPADVLASVGGPAPRAAARHADRWLLEYEAAAQVRGLAPDFAALRATGIRSLIATAPSDMASYDIVSRNFAPIVGVDEDQVTGMAHTCLAPHWAGRLGPRLRAYQASARGGAMTTLLLGDRVQLGGEAVVEVVAEWRAPPTLPQIKEISWAAF